jgi:hypothetical protein
MQMFRFGQISARYPRRAVPNLIHHDAGHGSYGTAGAQAGSSRKIIFGFFACIAHGGGGISPWFGDIMMVVTGVVTLYLYSIGSVLVSSAIFLWHPTLDPGQLRDAPPSQCEHMGCEASTDSSARYPGECLVAEPGREIPRKRIPCGVFKSVPELVEAIDESI